VVIPVVFTLVDDLQRLLARLAPAARTQTPSTAPVPLPAPQAAQQQE